ncbi:MAG: hypothetical protein Q9162_006383 [Coniocarpon cinnabarinum]
MPPKNPGLPTQEARRAAKSSRENFGDQEESSEIRAQSVTTKQSKGMSRDDWQYYLRNRNADAEKKADDWWEGILKDKINERKKNRLTVQTVDSLIALAQDFVDQNSHERQDITPEALHQRTETFHKVLCEKLWEGGSSSINEHDFNVDLRDARDTNRNRNESFFKNTVMMYFTDHWRFDDTFACSCNQAWKKDAPALLLRKGLGDTPNFALASQPDLAISFEEQALRRMNEDSMPAFADEIMSQRAISPEGSPHLCFPFLVIEVKKTNGDMPEAHLKSHYTATRALNNMFLCMRRAKKMEEFFTVARTFSVNVSPTEFEARIHRIVWNDEKEQIEFTHRPLHAEMNYGRNQITAMIRVIVVEYARTFLLPLLQDVYATITRSAGRRTEAEVLAGEDVREAWTKVCSSIEQCTEENFRRKLDKRKAHDDVARSPKRHGAEKIEGGSAATRSRAGQAER